MKFYLVGGACRDMILGIPPKDYDYCVTNASIDWFLDNGFSRVGHDFPVFLHPVTQEEYAMARSEKLIENSSKLEFEMNTSNISIEEDLRRRDFTMNSMALEVQYDASGVCTIIEPKEVIDPFNGRLDLKNGVLKHTSEFFIEDPLRIMRACRMAANYKLKIDEKTFTLCSKMIKQNLLSKIKQPRIFLEIKKGLSNPNAKLFLQEMQKMGVREHIKYIPEQSLGTTKNLDAIDFFETIEDDTQYLEAVFGNNEIIKFTLAFHNTSAKILQANFVPVLFCASCDLYKKFKDNLKEYSAWETDKKLSFIQRTKALHSFFAAQLFLFISYCTHEDKALYFNNIKALVADIAKLKQLDYEAISQNYIGNAISKKIEEEQTKALSTSSYSVKGIKNK